MRIIGPEWPSTRLLQEKIDGITRATGSFKWGSGGLDGVEQLKRFRAAGVACPVFTTSLAEAKQWEARAPGSVWGRAARHSKGRDIVSARQTITTRRGNRITRDNPKWLASDFWVKVIPNIQAEWRMQIFNGKSIGRGLKVKTEEIERPGNVVQRRGLLIRNRLTGWKMRHDVKPPEEVREIAKAAVKALGYLYGAVDLAVDQAGKVWVFEVNSAPGLDDSSAEAYAKAIVGYTQNG